MKNKTLLVLTTLVAASLWSASTTALPLFGKSKHDNTPPDGFVPSGREDRQEEQHQGMNAKDAARQAQSLNGGGRVLSVDEANGGWRVKLLKDGNVRFVFVPN